MNCVFNKSTKKFTGTAIRWDMPEILADEIIINLPDVPDSAIRLNDTNDGIRPATQAEINADTDAEKDLQVEAEFTPALLAVIEALSPSNSATIIAQAKAKRKTKL